MGKALFVYVLSIKVIPGRTLRYDHKLFHDQQKPKCDEDDFDYYATQNHHLELLAKTNPNKN